MIVDRLNRCEPYLALNAGLAAGFAFLRRPDLAELPPGRHEIDGTRVFAIVGHETGRGQAGARLEVHRQYLDIQVSLDGREQIGWRALADCKRLDTPYDADRDIAFYADAPALWLPLAREQFMIFLPHDAHAPLAGSGALHKAVVKIAMNDQR